jgi:two-component system chemotaxis response regulator CheY
LARKILLADDSVTAQNMGRKILADAGYEVITVNNGSAALKKISELKPDLVILDVYMPGYSGLEVCQRLKESQDSSRIPVLLTVGKLEPFKPEEAQRVRAEGFIVKPFEASELLSALSKLEDKVVPRAESSKPGRFARAIAAAEEAGRGGRNDAAGDDDGWKSRISFPHQKTDSEEKEKEKDTDAAAFFNPINRDLRTVVETPAELAAERAAEQEHKLHLANKLPEPSVDVAALVPPGLPQDVTPEEVAAIAAAAAQIQMIGAVVKDEPKSAPDRVEPESVKDVAHHSAPLMNAEATQENKKIESTQEEKDKSEEPREDPQDVPVTMAAATEGPGSASQTGSRWSAVPVALEGDEATISLDQEMQKAYAAFVAEEVASTAGASLPQTLQSENSSAPAEPEIAVAAISNPAPEPVSQSQAALTADAGQIESVPPAPLAISSSVSIETASFPETASASLPQTEAQVAPSVTEPVASREVQSDVQSEVTQSAATDSEAAPSQAAHSDAPLMAEPAPVTSQPMADLVSSIVETTVANFANRPQEESHPAPEAATPEAVASSHSFTSFTSTPHTEEREDENRKEEYKEESEAVKSTAAAWASWRQIRDAVEAKPAAESSRQESEESVTVESAAMAVAAGAEHNAQETPAPASENPSDIAGIVDSVLADLRPRLMAEISRKMSEKK